MEVKKLTIESILSPDVFIWILDCESEVEKVERFNLTVDRASELKVCQRFKTLYNAYKKDNEKANTPVKKEFNSAIPFIMNGDKIFKIKENMRILLENLGISLRYNMLTKRIEFTGIDHDDSVADITFIEIRNLARRNGFVLSKDDTRDFILAIANDYKYNPILDYLNNCKGKCEPNTSEVDRLLDTLHFEIEDEDVIAFYRNMAIKWLLGTVQIAHNTIENGYSVEFILTFKGKQGLGKTRWANSFIPKRLYKDGVTLNLEKVDSIAQATKYWVVELGEIASTFKRSDIDKLKGFITTKADEYRSPYGYSSNIYPRLTSFIGTVNDDTFLRDKTGNRRYVVLPVEKMDYENDIDADLLWGQLMHMYDAYVKEGKPFYMTQEEQATNDIYNLAYTTKSDVEIVMDDLLDWDNEKQGACTVSMIAKFLRDETGKVFGENSIKNVLASKGYKTELFRAGVKGAKISGRYYKMPFTQGMSLPF